MIGPCYSTRPLTASSRSSSEFLWPRNLRGHFFRDLMRVLLACLCFIVIFVGGGYAGLQFIAGPGDYFDEAVKHFKAHQTSMAKNFSEARFAAQPVDPRGDARHGTGVNETSVADATQLATIADAGVRLPPQATGEKTGTLAAEASRTVSGSRVVSNSEEIDNAKVPHTKQASVRSGPRHHRKLRMMILRTVQFPDGHLERQLIPTSRSRSVEFAQDQGQ